MKIICEHNAHDQDILKVKNSLFSFNTATGHKDDGQSLNVFLKDENNEVYGGVIANTYWRWLHVKYMWISESHRSKGYGQKLLLTAEQEAIDRGCTKAHLDTFSFQSLPFLKKNGYEIFGVLEDCPKGQRRYFLQKQNLEGLNEY